VAEAIETYFGSACVNDFDFFDARAWRDCTSDKPGAWPAGASRGIRALAKRAGSDILLACISITYNFR
jgi:hypothetical protein